MCRIFGFIGNSNEEVVRIVNGLIVAEEEKNPHGTGLVLLDENKEFILKKKGVRGLHFITRGYSNFLWSVKFTHLIGHVRYKTSGEQSDRNAHPFGSKVGKRWYFLIHNGVLGERMREIAENFGANKLTDVKVDSELFLRCITAQIRQGEKLVDAIKSATYEVSNVGDYAFALLTSEGIYLWRNEYRPLSVFYHKNNIFFASTMEMWKNALEIAGVEQEKIVYTEIEPHQLYILKINKGKPAVFRICEIPHKTHKRELERLNYSYYTSILSENGKNGNKKAKKKNKEKEDPRYNPFLFGEFANDDEEETHIFFGDKSPREMTTREIEREIEILEEYYYDGNLSISEQVEVERRLQELYYELNVRNTFVDDEEEAENVEPF